MLSGRELFVEKVALGIWSCNWFCEILVFKLPLQQNSSRKPHFCYFWFSHFGKEVPVTTLSQHIIQKTSTYLVRSQNVCQILFFGEKLQPEKVFNDSYSSSYCGHHKILFLMKIWADFVVVCRRKTAKIAKQAFLCD